MSEIIQLRTNPNYEKISTVSQTRLRESKKERTNDEICVFVFSGLHCLFCFVGLFLLLRRLYMLTVLDKQSLYMDDYVVAIIGLVWIMWMFTTVGISIVLTIYNDSKIWKKMNDYFNICLIVNTTVVGATCVGIMIFILRDEESLFVTFVRRFLIVGFAVGMLVLVNFVAAMVFTLRVLRDNTR